MSIDEIIKTKIEWRTEETPYWQGKKSTKERKLFTDLGEQQKKKKERVKGKKEKNR